MTCRFLSLYFLSLQYNNDFIKPSPDYLFNPPTMIDVNIPFFYHYSFHSNTNSEHFRALRIDRHTFRVSVTACRKNCTRCHTLASRSLLSSFALYNAGNGINRKMTVASQQIGLIDAATFKEKTNERNDNSTFSVI